MHSQEIVKRHIREFVEHIDHLNIETESDFMRLMSITSRFYGIHYTVIANRLNKHPSTISRWVAQTKAPQRVEWPLIIMEVKNLLLELAENFE